MKNLLTFLAGLGFGIGLIISGMTNPAKVIGFLDLFGVWDPSLMFVMIGAIFVTFFGFKFIEKRKMTFFEEALHLSGKTHINKDLVVGSILFGAGWAIEMVGNRMWKEIFAPNWILLKISVSNISLPLVFI